MFMVRWVVQLLMEENLKDVCGMVFNFKLGHFVKQQVLHSIHALALTEFKTQPRFHYSLVLGLCLFCKTFFFANGALG